MKIHSFIYFDKKYSFILEDADIVMMKQIPPYV